MFHMKQCLSNTGNVSRGTMFVEHRNVSHETMFAEHRNVSRETMFSKTQRVVNLFQFINVLQNFM